MANEYLIVATETTFGTWVTPTIALPVIKSSHAIGREYIDRRYSGTGRELSRRYRGAKTPSGSTEMDLFPEYMGRIFRASGFDVTTSTPGGATTAREHAFLLGSSPILKSLSMQYKRSGSVATNILSAIINKLTLKCVKKETAMLTWDYIAKDEAPAGGTWDFDGSSSAAIISSPTSISASLAPFIFTDAALIIGGTPSLTSSKYSVSGGTAIAVVESVEITHENNLDPAHFLKSDATPGVIAAQDAATSIKMDIDMSTWTTTYYDYARAGTNVSLQLTFTGGLIESGQNYMLQWTLPQLSFGGADYPEISGDQKRRVQSIEATAIVHPASAYSQGITIRDAQTAY